MCSFRNMFLLIAIGHLLLLYKHVGSFNPDFCVGITDGNYINVVNCGTYYRCTAEVALLLYCPWGRMFNPVADGCIIHVDAFCPLTCSVLLPVPFQAMISHPPTPGPFDVAVYICNSGYRLVGNPSLTCGPDGTWLGQQPTCVRAADGPPAPLPMLGTKTILGHRFGGTSIGLHGVIGSPALCADLCRATAGCVAANFFKIELQCELLSTKPLDYSLLNYTPANFDFVELLN